MSELSERIRKHADIYTKLSDGWRQIIPLPSELNQAADALEAQEARIKALEKALDEAIAGYEEGSQYKGDYLRDKHGDDEEIQALRGILRLDTPVLTLSKAPSIK